MKLTILPRSSLRLLSTFVFLLLAGSVLSAQAQALRSIDRERGHTMLSQIKDDIKGGYYDSTYRGVDLDARFKSAHEMLDKANSLGQVFGIIAQTVIGLNDSHTFFVPPEQTVHADYGWQLQAIGDKCYVVAVKPGSDAEAKGLRPGDEILAINGVKPNRAEVWKLRYLYYTLRPQPGMRLLVKTPEGAEKALDALAKVRTDKARLDFTNDTDIYNTIRRMENESQLRRHRYSESGDDVFIWKMPQFGETDTVDAMMKKVGDHKALILDLRGNGGGSVLALQRLVGQVFDKDITIGDTKRRKENKGLVAKTRGQNAYKGKLVVLVDSESGSAAEVFARIVQLEKRGTVIGDRSAGAVMLSKFYAHQMGNDTVVPFGISITDADLIMTDGKSLENTGVVPDELMLLTPKDLASKQDPVLTRAAELVGVNLDPAKAGALFPREWEK